MRVAAAIVRGDPEKIFEAVALPPLPLSGRWTLEAAGRATDWARIVPVSAEIVERARTGPVTEDENRAAAALE